MGRLHGGVPSARKFPPGARLSLTAACCHVKTAGCNPSGCQPGHAPTPNSALHPIFSASHASGVLLAPLGLKVTSLSKYLGISELVQLVGLEHQPALALGESLALLVSVLQPCSKGPGRAWRMSWVCMFASVMDQQVFIQGACMPARPCCQAGQPCMPCCRQRR